MFHPIFEGWVSGLVKHLVRARPETNYVFPKKREDTQPLKHVGLFPKVRPYPNNQTPIPIKRMVARTIANTSCLIVKFGCIIALPPSPVLPFAPNMSANHDDIAQQHPNTTGYDYQVINGRRSQHNNQN